MTDNNQQLATKEVLPDLPDGGIGAAVFLRWLTSAGENLPPYYSEARDAALNRLVKSSDHLSSAVSTFRQMMVVIPVKVTARDQSIKAHLKLAKEYTAMLQNNTESRSNFAAQGWGTGFGPFVQNFTSSDNGGFMLIEGEGLKIDTKFGKLEGPIISKQRKLVHLDSTQCYRTQIADWPVRYVDLDGQEYLLHKSRVIALSDMSDPLACLYGVGFCAVSRCANKAQEMKDISTYKGEKLGSRPKRAILAVSGKAGPRQLVKATATALEEADAIADNEGLKNYSPVSILGLPDGGGLELVDLNSIPDGFDELTSTQLAMMLFAWAFGVDARQFAFAMGVTGATKGDSEIQHLKMWGKLPGYFVQEFKTQIEAKFLPPSLKLVFDNQDDSQDSLRADIRLKRADRRKLDLEDEVTDIRTEREQMLETGEITEPQFIAMELKDGRLPDGEPVMTLFFNQDPVYADLLSIGLDAEIDVIDELIRTYQNKSVNGPTSGMQSKARFALAALQELKNVRGEQEKLEQMAEDDERAAEEVGLAEEGEEVEEEAEKTEAED